MNIERLGPVDPAAKFKKTNKVERPVKSGKEDSISISSDAKTMGEVFKASEQVKKGSSDVRMDKVNEVKRKLEDPNYINGKIVESVADSIMDVFGLS